MSCCSLGDRIRPWFRDYDRLQSLAVILIYIQIACALVGSLGAQYNGVLLVNFSIALFALVAIASSSQSLGRTYAVLLFCAILLDISWFILFTSEIWNVSSTQYGALYIFSLRLTLAMQIIGFSVWWLSSFLWIQICRLGVSHTVNVPDFDVRNSFLSPTTPAAREPPNPDEVLGGSTCDPAYYPLLYEDGQNSNHSSRSWAVFKPSKTTVKRMLLRGPRKGSTSKFLFKRPAHSCSKDAILPSTFSRSLGDVVHEACGEMASRSPSAPIRQGSSFASPMRQNLQTNSISDFSLMSATKSSIFDCPGKIHSTKVIDEERGSGATFKKLASSAVDQTRSKMQPEGNFIQGTPFPLKSPSETTPLQIISDESTPIDKDTGIAKTASGSLKHEPKTNESSLFGKAVSSSSTEVISMSSSLPEKVHHAGLLLHKSPLGEVTTSPATSPSSATRTLLSTMSSIKSSLSSKGSLEGPWTIGGATADAAHSIPSKSLSSLPLSTGTSDAITSSSFFPLPSSSSPLFSFQIPKFTMPSSTTSPSITSGSESQKAEVQTNKSLANLELGKGAKESTAAEAISTVVELFTSKSGLKVDSSLLPSQKVNISALSASTGEISVGRTSTTPVRTRNVMNPASSMALNIQKEQATATHVMFPTSESNTNQKAENLDVTEVQEGEMEEEAPETNNAPDLGLGSLGGFGIGSSSNAITPKGDPFGTVFSNAAGSTTGSPFALTVPSGKLFHPASFSFQSQQASQPSQPPNLTAFSGGFGAGGNAQPPAQSRFGRPAHIGPEQQALGSVLRGFRQSSQIGSHLPGAGFASSSGFGGGFMGGSTSSGISSSPGVGGIATVGSTGGGLPALAPGGGFAGSAAAGGGFAAFAAAGGGFAGVAAAGAAPGAGFGGFATAASAGGGFAGAATGSGFSGAGSIYVLDTL